MIQFENLDDLNQLFIMKLEHCFFLFQLKGRPQASSQLSVFGNASFKVTDKSIFTNKNRFEAWERLTNMKR